MSFTDRGPRALPSPKRSVARAATVLAICAALSTVGSFYPSWALVFLAMLLMLVGGGIWTVSQLARAIAHMIDGHNRLAASQLIIGCVGVLIAWVGLRLGDYLHLAIDYPGYRVAIGHAPGRSLAFDWGTTSMFATDGYQHRTLVYDPRPQARLLRPRSERREGMDLTIVRSSFVGDFYLDFEQSQ